MVEINKLKAELTVTFDEGSRRNKTKLGHRSTHRQEKW
jgi:hypothetical protein